MDRKFASTRLFIAVSRRCLGGLSLSYWMLLVLLIGLVLGNYSGSDATDGGGKRRGKAGPSPTSRSALLLVSPLSEFAEAQSCRCCCCVRVQSLCCVTFCDGDERGVGVRASFWERESRTLSVRVRGYSATVLCKGQWEATPRNGSGKHTCHTS